MIGGVCLYAETQYESLEGRCPTTSDGMNPSARTPGESASCWGWDESALFPNNNINRGVEWDWTYYSENPLMPHFGLRGGGPGGAEVELKPQILVGAPQSSSSSLSQIMLNSAGLRGIGTVPWSHGSLRDIVMKRDPEDLQATIGLNLGARTYFSSSAPGNSFCRRPRANSPGSVQIPRCQAEGCKANLSNAKHYHRRHRVCELHSKASTVTAGGLIQRFCQQCSRFHVISEFDEGKRSCRKRLADHNRRRRKRPPAVINESAPPEANSSSHSVGPAMSTPILKTTDDTRAKAPSEDGGRTGERYSQGITQTAPHLSAVPFVTGLIGNQLASGLDVWLKAGASSSEFAGSVDLQSSSSLAVVDSSCRSSANFEAFSSHSSQVLDHTPQISSGELIAGGSEWNMVGNLCENGSRNYNAAPTQMQYLSRDPNLQQRPSQVLSFHSFRDFIPRAANETPPDTKRAA